MYLLSEFLLIILFYFLKLKNRFFFKKYILITFSYPLLLSAPLLQSGSIPILSLIRKQKGN